MLLVQEEEEAVIKIEGGGGVGGGKTAVETNVAVKLGLKKMRKCLADCCLRE